MYIAFGRLSLSIIGRVTTLCEVDRSGRILGPRSQVLGEVRPFSYALQREVALYCCFLDPGLLDSPSRDFSSCFVKITPRRSRTAHRRDSGAPR